MILKKILVVLLSGIMMVSLAACGNSSGSETNDGIDSTQHSETGATYDNKDFSAIIERVVGSKDFPDITIAFGPDEEEGGFVCGLIVGESQVSVVCVPNSNSGKFIIVTEPYYLDSESGTDDYWEFLAALVYAVDYNLSVSEAYSVSGETIMEKSFSWDNFECEYVTDSGRFTISY